MNKHGDEAYLRHILQMIDEIAFHLRDGGKGAFFGNPTVCQATLRSLQLLSESCKRLSETTKKRLPDIPWSDIAGFRNILVHDYLGDINYTIVWGVVERELPKLKITLSSYIHEHLDKHS